MVVWFGLDQLAQVIELFTPVVNTIIAPSHLSLETTLTDQSQPSTLFKRGDGVNVYSEGCYTLQTYYSCIQQYLLHGNPGMDLILNMDNVLLVGHRMCEMLETEKSVFSKIRTVKGFKMIISVQTMVNLTAKLEVTKTKPDEEQKKELETICSLFNKHILWPGFVL